MPSGHFDGRNWTKEEDQTLQDHVKACQTAGVRITWSALADKLGRTVLACMSRHRKPTKKPSAPSTMRYAHKFKSEYRRASHADMEPIADPSCYIRIPESDPLLKRLIHYHGNDEIDRNFHV